MGIPRVAPYEKLHTFVSVAKKLPDGQIKPLVGHAKDMDTFGIYGHQMDGDDEETAMEINEIFSKIIQSGL